MNNQTIEFYLDAYNLEISENYGDNYIVSLNFEDDDYLEIDLDDMGGVNVDYYKGGEVADYIYTDSEEFLETFLMSIT